MDSLAHAHALPEEILSSIFILASHIDNSQREFDDFSVDNDALVSTWPSKSISQPQSPQQPQTHLQRDPYGWYRSPFNTRLAISHVCKYWRLVSLHTPTLWSRITFDSSDHDRFPTSTPSSAYLTRSSSLPLSILLKFRSSQALSRILLKLSPHYGRVREMRIVTYYPVGQDDMDMLFWYDAPILEELHFRVLAPLLHENHRVSTSGPPFNGRATRLRTLHFRNVHIPTFFCPLLYFRNLAKLELSPLTYKQRPTYDQFVQTLTASPVLETLILQYACPSTYWENWPQASIHLPSLKRLAMTHESLSETSALVHRLHVPKLGSLQLTFEFNHYWFNQGGEDEEGSFVGDGDILILSLTGTRQVGEETLGPFVQSIETLVLYGQLPCTEPYVTHLYASSPNLKALFLNMRRLSPTFFRTLCTKPGRTPNLKTVGYHRDTYRWSDCGPVRLVKSRASAGFPLDELRLDPEEVRDLGKEDELYLKETSGVRCAFWTAPKPGPFWDADMESDEEI